MQSIFVVALNNAFVAGVLGLLVLAIGRVWRRPALVHALWLVVLVKLVTPGLISIPLPFARSSVPADVRVYVAVGDPEEHGTESRTGSADTLTDTEIEESSPASSPTVGESGMARSRGASGTQPAPDSAAGPSKATHSPYRVSLFTCLLAVWVVGACAFLLRSVVSIVRFQRLLRYAESAGATLQERIDQLAAAMKIPRPPAAFVVPGAVSPMLWAFGWRARLLLPGQLLEELSDEAKATVIVHELAHFQRGDHRVRALELIVGSLFWWHPIVWLATRELRQIEEECCDACVVAQLPGHRSTYARTLVRTIGFLSARPALLPAAAGALGKGIYQSVEQRIRSIMSDSPTKGVRMSPRMRFALIAFALVVLPLVPATGEGDAKPAVSTETTSSATKKPPAEEPTSFSGSVAALGNVTDIAVSPDGRLLAAGHGLHGGPGSLSVWDLKKSRLIGSFGERRAVINVVFSKDGRFLAYGTRDNIVGIRRSDTLAVVQELPGMDFLPLYVAFSPDGRQLSVAHKKVVVYDTGTWKPLPIEFEEDPLLARDSFALSAVDISADGSRILAAGGNGDSNDLYGRTVVWDAKTGKQVCATPHTSRLFKSVFSPDGTLFATAGEDGRSQICDTETGEVLRLGSIRGTPLYDVAWSADGKTLVGAGAIRGHPVFDAASGKTLHVFAKPEDGKVRLNTACFTPDGTKIITGSSEKTISIWDASTFAQLSQFPSSDVTPVAAQSREGFADANAERVEAFLRKNFSEGSAGMVIGLVDRHGSRVFSAGKLDNGTDQEMNGDTVFEIGSVTKTFTVLLLLEMAKRGEMKLDDPVANYLPPEVRVPSHGRKEITLLNLAAQDSGLPFNPDNLSSKPFPENYNEYAARDLYSFLGSYNLQVDPGSGAVYSNAGMTLLGHVMERKTGTGYESLVTDRICRPLKMEDTCVSLTPGLKSRLAMGHDQDGKPAPPYKLQVIAPAGALLSTANDLLKYLSANLGFTQTDLNPLMREMQVIRHTRGVIDTQEMGRTAMPWCDEGTYNPPGANLLGHAGGCPGYSSFIGMDLEGRRGVVVLSNQRRLRPASTGWQILQGMPFTTDNMLVREHLGIGVALTFDDTAKRVRISNVFLKSPAAEAGLTKGLLIRKINGTDVDGKQANDCFDLMRGPAGTSIRLDVVDSKGKETTVNVTKRKFLTLT